MDKNNHFDVIVVGGGHAGLEASFACAHMGMKTLLITLNIKMMANMPCNPSIGGSAKGIVVREIDALGGMMGKIADKHYLQMKMLNVGKGVAVQCLRAQEDKLIYPYLMQQEALSCPNLTVIEGEVIDLISSLHQIDGVILKDGTSYYSKATILTTGTYMQSEILVGHSKTFGGPDGEKPSLGLSPNLKKLGLKLYRLKTGTPPRIKKESIDFSKTIPQYGDKRNLAFSYETKTYLPFEQQYPCYLIYTNAKTHKIILDNLEKSAMYSGLVKGIGPRYCPSIEDKIVRFKDKERHQLFLEPESVNTNSIYLQGFSTSMPKEVQIEMVHSLPGLEKAEFLKYAYAIEYDAIDTSEFDSTLQIKKYNGLYIAGQICGTSGYEEAAALGLLAGINATLKILNKPPLILRRDQSYIGVMIDDLVFKGTKEPYRLLSSRAEFRLLLRHDNADIRLSKIGYEIGLLPKKRYEIFENKMKNIEKVTSFLKNNYISVTNLANEYLNNLGYPNLKGGVSYYDLIKRDNVYLKDLYQFDEQIKNFNLDDETIQEIEISAKYEGYILNSVKQAEKQKKLEDMIIPSDFDYLNCDGLALEARQKLDEIKPYNIGQASRISGVNPSDINILIYEISKGSKYGK